MVDPPQHGHQTIARCKTVSTGFGMSVSVCPSTQTPAPDCSSSVMRRKPNPHLISAAMALHKHGAQPLFYARSLSPAVSIQFAAMHYSCSRPVTNTQPPSICRKSGLRRARTQARPRYSEESRSSLRRVSNYSTRLPECTSPSRDRKGTRFGIFKYFYFTVVGTYAKPRRSPSVVECGRFFGLASCMKT